MSTQYCWIKVLRTADVENLSPQPPISDVGLWPQPAAAPNAAFLTPLTSTNDPGQPRKPWNFPSVTGDASLIMAACAPCPATPHKAGARFLDAPPPPPSSASPVPGAGWMLECGPVAENYDHPPEVYFSMHPMPAGTDRAAALNWLRSQPGDDWSKGAMACTLIAYFA
ncbi:hypothetical protein ACS5PN_18835 [Roseateles sp. NT4]|uniref:hypothetical protein n=1 Tax=Roseateles sp. NT4 TaxID=3453715 RepID=UPI003EEDB59D